MLAGRGVSPGPVREGDATTWPQEAGKPTSGVYLVREGAGGELEDHSVEAAVAKVDPLGVAMDEGAEAVHAALAGSLGRNPHVLLARIDADHPASQAPGQVDGGTAVAAADVEHS